MVEIQVKGIYGTALTVDDEGVTLRAKGLMAAGAHGAGEGRIRFTEITDLSFAPANMAKNGHVEIVTVAGKSTFRYMIGSAAPAVEAAFDLIVERAPDAIVEKASRRLMTPSGAEAETPAEKAAAKLVAKTAKVEGKQEARAEKEQAKRDRAAEILAKYGSVAAQAMFGGSTVAIYSKGFVRVSPLFMTDSTPFDELRSISYSRTVQDKSAGGRAAAAVMTGGLSRLASNEKRDTFLSIATNRGAHSLKATGRASESSGLALEAAGKGVLDALRAQPLASSAPAGTSTRAPARAVAAPDPTEQVMKLAQLHAQGILSDDEFTKAKAKALGI